MFVLSLSFLLLLFFAHLLGLVVFVALLAYLVTFALVVLVAVVLVSAFSLGCHVLGLSFPPLFDFVALALLDLGYQDFFLCFDQGFLLIHLLLQLLKEHQYPIMKQLVILYEAVTPIMNDTQKQ